MYLNKQTVLLVADEAPTCYVPECTSPAMYRIFAIAWPRTVFGPSYAEIGTPYHACWEHRATARPALLTSDDWGRISTLFGSFIGDTPQAEGVEIEARLITAQEHEKDDNGPS